MSQPFVGEICPMPYMFSPYGWAYCSGQTIPIVQYQMLFAIIGNFFGGNGTTTFSLPDLKNSAVMGAGAGSGLTPRVFGEVYGEASIQLHLSQLPAHIHDTKFAMGHSSPPQPNPRGNYLGGLAEIVDGTVHACSIYEKTTAENVSFLPSAMLPAGSNGAHENQQPFLALNFCIALMGVWPARP